jgi:uncharacterized protein (TIGR03382 family)
MGKTLRSVLVGSTSLLLSCGDPSPQPAAAPARPSTPVTTVPATPAATALRLGATPLAVNDRGVPHLLRGTEATPKLPAADATSTARQHVARLAPAWGVRSAAKMPTLDAIGEAPVFGNDSGTKVVRFRQVLDGLPVDRGAGGEMHVMVAKDGSFLASSGALIGTDTPRPALASVKFVDDDAGAVARAVGDLYKKPVAAAALAMTAAATDGTRMLAGTSGDATTGVNVSLSRARKMWVAQGQTLVPAWVVEAYSSPMNTTDGDAYRTVISAGGKILSRTNLKADVAFSYRVFAETTGENHPFDGPIADITPQLATHPNTVAYPPYVLPNLITVDGLNHPAGTTQPDSWLAAGRTETIGNNVEAYTDLNPPDGLTFGDFRAVATSPGVFDRTYNTAGGALDSQDQQMAAITALFYNINFMHDFWYDGGFTEAAGNSQNVNFGRGGEDRDAMLGEAQDNALGGSRNNANMSTPEDGMPTRMQVFVWDGADDRSIGVNNRKPAAGPSAFGSKHFTTTGSVTLANDATAPATDACQPLTAPVTGQIVLADRGSCTFKTKALNAQNAGAAAIIIADNAAGTAPPSLGDDPAITTPITIGVLSVTQADGALIKGDLAKNPIQATVHRVVGPDLDGTLDATVVGHEFGHSVHHRVSVCNTSLCGAMSEGWADFSALLLVVRKGDNYDAAFPLAGYSTRSFPADPVFYGIRRAPYSNNHAINGLSFRHMQQGEPLPPAPFNGGSTANNNEVHNGGEVWASMLWEGYSAMLDQPGADFDATRLKMRQYAIAGLQLAPTDATPTETRDAILAAVHARSQADFDLLAAAYARRGFGSCAVSPPRDSVSFLGVVESFDVKGKLAAGAPTMQIVNSCDSDDVLDGGETARITVSLANPGGAALADTSAELTSTTPGVHIMTPHVAVGALAALGQTTVSFDVQLDDSITAPTAGDFTLTFAASNGCDPSVSVPFSVRLNTDDAANTSATDTFDAGSSPWTQAGLANTWTHDRATPLNGVWHGTDVDGPSDASLVSPKLAAGTGPVTITFSHTFDFENDGAGTAFDGGVIEYSTDGATWQDISGIADPGYNATITSDPLTSGNPIAGRPGYGFDNKSAPNPDTVTLNLGTALAGQNFQIRFRVGSDSNTGAGGWTIDNLAVTGITNTPFTTLVADAGECAGAPDAGAPTPGDGGIGSPPPPGVDGGPGGGSGNPGGPGGGGGGGGGGCQTGSGAAGMGAALALLAVLVRRRKR